MAHGSIILKLAEKPVQRRLLLKHFSKTGGYIIESTLACLFAMEQPLSKEQLQKWGLGSTLF